MENDLRITYLSPSDISGPTGHGVNEREFAVCLLNRYRNNTQVVLPRTSRPILSELDEGHVSWLSRESRGTLADYLRYELEAYRAIVGSSARFPADAPRVLAARVTLWPLAVTLAARRLDIPMVLRLTDVIEYEVVDRKVPSPLRSPVKRSISMAFGRCLRSACHAVAVTDTIGQHYVAEYGVRQDLFTTVPNGVNVDLFIPRPKEQARALLGLTGFQHLVGYVGSVYRRVGLGTIIKASEVVLGRRRDVGFIVVGGGDGLLELREMVERHHLSQHFIFTDWVPYEAIPHYVAALDIGLTPLRKEKMRLSGSSSQKVRQYLACGVPVIATPGDGHDFLADNGVGVVIDPEDPIEFGHAICSLLELRGTDLESLRRRAREYAVANFSMDNVIARYLDVWSAAANSTLSKPAYPRY